MEQDHFTESDDVPAEWSSARPLLRAVLRPVTHGMETFGDAALVRRPAFPFIDEIIVLDLPRTRAYVTVGMAADWAVDPEALFATARENLADLAHPGSPDALHLTRFLDSGDSYFASWLLIPGWLASYAGGHHRPVAFIPDVDTLLIVPGDPDLLPEVFEMIEAQYREATHHISPHAYTVDDSGMVIPLDHLPDHPAHEQALRARSGLSLTEYAIQTRFLTTKFDEDLDLIPFADVDPAYVATPAFAQSESGPITLTAWGEGVEYLLPQADYIHFLQTGPTGEVNIICTVPFDSAVEILGLIPLPGLNPPRFEARRWPTPESFTKLRAASVMLE